MGEWADTYLDQRGIEEDRSQSRAGALNPIRCRVLPDRAERPESRSSSQNCVLPTDTFGARIPVEKNYSGTTDGI